MLRPGLPAAAETPASSPLPWPGLLAAPSRPAAPPRSPPLRLQQALTVFARTVASTAATNTSSGTSGIESRPAPAFMRAALRSGLGRAKERGRG